MPDELPPPTPSRSGFRTFIAEIVRLAPSFLLLTVAGGLVTHLFQYSATRATLRAQEVAANRVAATELYKEVSAAIGRRLYLAQVAVMWAPGVSPRPFVSPEQVAASRDWYERGPSLRAMTCRFFGPEEALVLQELVLKLEYVEMLRGLERDLHEGKFTVDSLARWFPEAQGGPDSVRARMLHSLDSLAAAAYMFNLDLVDRVRSGRFARSNGPSCADEQFRSFEQLSGPLWRFRLYTEPRDTLLRRRRSP